MVRLLLLGAWVLLLVGCSAAPHVIRYRTASGAVWTYRPAEPVKPIEISEDQLRETIRSFARDLPRWKEPLEGARRAFGIPELSGDYLYEVRTRRLLPESSDSPMDEVSIQQWVRAAGGGPGGTAGVPRRPPHFLPRWPSSASNRSAR